MMVPPAAEATPAEVVGLGVSRVKPDGRSTVTDTSVWSCCAAFCTVTW